MKFKTTRLIFLSILILLTGCKKLSDDENFFSFLYDKMEYKAKRNIANLYEFDTITKCFKC